MHIVHSTTTGARLVHVGTQAGKHLHSFDVAVPHSDEDRRAAVVVRLAQAGMKGAGCAGREKAECGFRHLV